MHNRAFIFDLPDYDTYTNLELPCFVDVQLAAFAREVDVYQSEEIWERVRTNLLDAETIIHAHRRMPGIAKDPLQADVFVNARVLEASQLTNPITGLKFHWARVRTMGGEMDIVGDPQVTRCDFVPGGIVSGLFWLSGKILP
jgi:hypothetical protein